MQRKYVLNAIVAALLLLPVSVGADEFSSLLEEADAVRAEEFSPAAYAATKDAVRKRWIDEAQIQAKRAIANSLTVSNRFSKLVESRDRMHVSGAVDARRDLAERAEEAFSRVVAAVESDDLTRANKEAEMAALLTRQAEIVAAREQLTRPTSKMLAEARKHDGNRFAPENFKKADEGMKKVDRLVSSNPAARGQLVNESQNSLKMAEQSKEIGMMGNQMKKNPGMLEKWVVSRDNDLHAIAAAIGINIDGAKSREDQAAMIRKAIEQMLNGYETQLADAHKKIDELEGNSAELGEARYRLKLKREAEAKIAQLASLFDASQVELFLTTDADVIIRMKAMKFPSGSSIIPSASYDLLELASRAIDLFPDRVVHVEGHTDSIGNDAYNQGLSERRALTVKDYLDARYAENNRSITSAGLGEDRPIANNEKAEGRQKNRRIDIVLVAPPMKN